MDNLILDGTFVGNVEIHKHFVNYSSKRDLTGKRKVKLMSSRKGVAEFESTVNKKSSNEYEIEIPEGILWVQNREDARVAVTIKAKVTQYILGKIFVFDHALDVTILNLSASGLGFITDYKFPEDSCIHLTCNINGWSVDFVLLLVRDIKMDNGLNFYGCTISSLSMAEVLKDFIFNEMRRELKVRSN